MEDLIPEGRSLEPRYGTCLTKPYCTVLDHHAQSSAWPCVLFRRLYPNIVVKEVRIEDCADCSKTCERLGICLGYDLGSICRTVEPLESNPRGIRNMRGVFAWLLVEKEQLSDRGQPYETANVFGSYAFF